MLRQLQMPVRMLTKSLAATYVSFASIVYPGIKTVLAGPATVDVLNGIANGTCVGGMLNEVELRYAFGPGAQPQRSHAAQCVRLGCYSASF